MAKKKKRRQHRRPIAPPVHSAPGTVHAPPTRPAEPYTARPESPEPPEQLHTTPVYEAEPEPVRQRTRPQQKRRPPSRRRRRSNASRWIIVGLVIVAIVAAFVARSALNGKKSSAFEKVAAAADCGKVKTYSNLDRTHEPGVRVKYSTSPPVGGPHDPNPLPGGVYDAAFSTDPAKQPSIYQAVHSLEHGYVIVWYNNLSGDEKDSLTKALTGEQKVIVVPYPAMPDGHKMALTAWGRLDYCGKPSTKAAQAFINLYRNAPSAPEYYQPAI
jgi:hypothetical protein